jgi:hypothetical protein
VAFTVPAGVTDPSELRAPPKLSERPEPRARKVTESARQQAAAVHYKAPTSRLLKPVLQGGVLTHVLDLPVDRETQQSLGGDMAAAREQFLQRLQTQTHAQAPAQTQMPLSLEASA